jgi:hypothetical protein
MPAIPRGTRWSPTPSQLRLLRISYEANLSYDTMATDFGIAIATVGKYVTREIAAGRLVKRKPLPCHHVTTSVRLARLRPVPVAAVNPFGEPKPAPVEPPPPACRIEASLRDRGMRPEIARITAAAYRARANAGVAAPGAQVSQVSQVSASHSSNVGNASA